MWNTQPFCSVNAKITPQDQYNKNTMNNACYNFQAVKIICKLHIIGRKLLRLGEKWVLQ